MIYTYKAKVTKVYDGDTITVDIDLGFGMIFSNQNIRLFGINAPEVRGVSKPQGIISRDGLRKMILGKTITLQTIKDSKGKYGRYLGIIILPKGESEININDWLVENNLAEKHDY